MYKFSRVFSIQMTPFFIDFQSVWPLIFTKPYIWLGPSFFGVLNPGTENFMKYPPSYTTPPPTPMISEWSVPPKKECETLAKIV